MEELALVLCLLGTSFTYPMYPQAAGTHGMASVSLENMRQHQTANKLTALPQFTRFGYNEPFSSLWLHGLLPPHTTYPWMHQRPQLPDNQQFEYALPIHPPPLPGAQSPAQPQIPVLEAQNFPQQPPATSSRTDSLPQQPSLHMGFPSLQQDEPTLTPQKVADGQIQTFQTIMNKLLQQGAGETVPEQAAVPPVEQQHPYPGLFYMQYGAGPGGPPARLGVMSSEEMQGGHAGIPQAFNPMYPGLLGMGPGVGSIQQNLPLQGDFTVEDDSPAAGGRTAGQGPYENPSGVGSSPSGPVQEGSPTGQGEAIQFPNINFPNSGLNPAGQSKLPPGVTPANVPRLTYDTGASFAPFGVDDTMHFGDQRETPINVDVAQANNAIDTPIMQNDINLQNHYFQEP
ncbi:ameloblastin isoform X2 [Ascaphus truei]|uniref:ameloblastin isoform X2 n=1 Tax=Ascaphus truei TaxID=8439 RepID=UPI003F598BC4